MFYERLNAICRSRGTTPTGLAKSLGLSTSRQNTWKKSGAPKGEELSKIADFLDVSTEYLLEKTDDPNPIKSNISAVYNSQNIYNIPVFESVSAGFGAYASNDILEYIPVVITNPADVEDTISIKVAGDSMYPKIEDGDIIIVRRQTSVDSGDIAVVLLDNDEGLVKRVVYGPTWIELQSINESYPVQRFDGAEVTRLRVVGKVVGGYKKF